MERTFTVTVDVPEVIAHADDWRLQQIVAKAIESQQIRPKTQRMEPFQQIVHLKVRSVETSAKPVQETPTEAFVKLISEIFTDKKTA